MIEMRWLVRRVPRLKGIDDGIYKPPLDPMIDQHMLQYREWPPGTHPNSERGLNPNRAVGPHQDYTYTEPNWIDVPMVREP